ncbi:hypothetical protein E1B28_008297 [Marasmius oreades]|uniref:RING-type domain-containing protein n=1 Tax=Marasmius oreades TaxID=181124 RepID=A0A9P7RZA2_9AGAR|nr:uncharacterized protein E1B28_008297 [Marasmius oreades]KAG7091896.1 hypothetical protein E1B28_008297 [Marasmius oreades]
MANPATPQRNNYSTRTHNPHVHSIAHPYIRDPISPPSPYTPLSLRSFPSSNASPASTLATPNSVTNFSPLVKRIPFSSPQIARLSSHVRSSSSSIADITQNWRNRATENGITVTDDSYIDDADVSLSDNSGFINEDEVPSQAAMSTQRRRALSYSHAGILPPVQNPPRTPARRLQPTSPTVFRKTLSSLSNTATPPKRNLAQQMRMKGCMTDPPQLRKREAFGVVPVASQNIPSNGNADASFELFDIDENDYEYDYDYENEQVELPLKGVDDSEYHYPSTGSQQLLPRLLQQSRQQPHINFVPQNYPINNPSMLSLFGQPTFSDPYIGSGSVGTGNPLNGRIADSVEHHFNQYQQQQIPYGNRVPPGLGLPLNMGLRTTNGQVLAPQLAPSLHPHRSDTSMSPIMHSLTPSFSPPTLPLVEQHTTTVHGGVPSPATSIASESKHVDITANDKLSSTPLTSCAVCSRSNLTRLAILSPCSHPLCSSCLTSALNIVGEKDMECASCKKEVVDFKLITNDTACSPNTSLESTNGRSFNNLSPRKPIFERRTSFTEPLPSSPKSTASGLESAFEFNGYGTDFDPDDVFSLGAFEGAGGIVRASTPPPKNRQVDRVKPGSDTREGMPKKGQKDPVVLRIDNVPWDITPPRISEWLQQPAVRVHVLLDRKGKTMSHAFVEVNGEEVAGAVLRGEAQQSEIHRFTGEKVKMRGSVLGKGRRARGVTVTRSSQQELMSALFPAWQGSFDGSRPSLAGLDKDRVVSALESGLMTEGDVSALLYLIRSPDAHFLKVPCLPFHSLISILRKFPADVDSRVFWSGSLRNVLFDVTFAAIQVLMARVESKKNDEEHTPELVDNLVRAGVECKVFTDEQIQKIMRLMRDTRHQVNEQLTMSESESIVSSPSSLVLARKAANSRSAHSGSSRVSSRQSAHHIRSHSRLAQSVTSSPASSSSTSFASDYAQADDEDEDDEEYDRHVLGQENTVHPTLPRTSLEQVGPLSVDTSVSHCDSSATAYDDDQKTSINGLAKEFGVEAHLVEALVQRLAGMR